MGISDEFKQRLRNIELEQKRQELALKKLDDFEEKIRELEAQLKQIDGFEIKLQQQIDYTQLRDLDETQRIETELKRMDEEYHARDFNELRYFEEIAELKAKLTGEINELKVRRERLLDRHQDTLVRPDTVQKVTPSVSPKAATNSPTSIENSEKSSEFAIQLPDTDYEVENAFEKRYFAEIQQLRNGVKGESTTCLAATKTRIIPKKTVTQSNAKKKSPSQIGYVICLMLNPEAPTEWSGELETGGGWREPGKGTCYTDIEQVKRYLRRLKKQWPSYPLKVIKRLY